MFAGAVALSTLVYLIDWLFFRQAVESGQYGWTMILTVPTGAVLGAITGLACGMRLLGQAKGSAAVSVAGGCLLGILLLDRSRGLGLLTFAAPYYLPLLWSGLLVATGLFRLKRITPSK